MIHVEFKKSHDRYVRLMAEGHALSGEYGHDLVCAAVSVLTITLANNLERMGEIVPILSFDPNGGYFDLELKDDMSEEQEQLAQTLLENCYLAFKEDLEPEYGQYVQVKLSRK